MLILIAAPALEAKAAKVALNKTEMTLVQRESARLYLAGYTKKITWSSSNKKIAAVSKAGVVKAAKAGTATITAKAGGKTYKCEVTVLPYLDSHYVDVAEKAAKTLSAHYLIKKPETVKVTDVYEGIYKKQSAGPDITEFQYAVAFTAEDESGKPQECTTVINLERDYALTSQSNHDGILSGYNVTKEKKLSNDIVKKINKLIPLVMSGSYAGNEADTYMAISNPKVAVRQGKTFTVSVNNAAKKVTWSSSDKKVATVSNKGVIKGVKPGKAKITAKVGKETFTCDVTVMNKYSDEDIVWMNTIIHYYDLSYSPADYVVKKVEYGEYTNPSNSGGALTKGADYTYKITLEVRFSDESIHTRYFWGNNTGNGGYFSVDNGNACSGTTKNEMSEKDLNAFNELLQNGAFAWWSIA